MAKTFATMWNFDILKVRKNKQQRNPILHFYRFVNNLFVDTGKTRIDQKEARKCKSNECPVDNFRNPYSYLAVQGLPETCKKNNVSRVPDVVSILVNDYQFDSYIFEIELFM